MVAAGIGLVELLESFARHDDALERLLPVEGDGIVLAPLPQAATDPDAADASFEHRAIDRVEDVSAVEDQRSRPGAERAQPQVVGKVVLVALGVECDRPTSGITSNPWDLTSPMQLGNAAKSGGGRPGPSALAISAQRWACPSPTPFVGMKTIPRAAGPAVAGGAGAARGAAGGAEPAQHRLGRGSGRGAASAHVVRDPAQVGQDLGAEEVVEPEDAGGRGDEGVALVREPVAGAAVQERRPGDEQVRGERCRR